MTNEEIEAQAVLSEIQEISFTINSNGWKLIEKRIQNMINTLYDIRTIPDELKGEEKLKEIELRQHTAALFESMLTDVKGEAERQKALEKPKEEQSHIIQYS